MGHPTCNYLTFYISKNRINYMPVYQKRRNFAQYKVKLTHKYG